MKKLTFVMITVIFSSLLFSQVNSDIKVKLTGQFEFISEYSEKTVDFRHGKTDIDFYALYKDNFGFTLVYCVYPDFNVALFDGYAFLKPVKGMTVKFGQFKNPFALERLTPPFERDFIEEAITTKLVSNRDFGIGMNFIKKSYEFNFAIFNGEGVNKKDVNTKKDLVFRAAVLPFDNFKIGSSLYKGKAGADSLLKKHNRYNLQIQYKIPFECTVQAEYTKAENSGFSENAFYLTLASFVPEKIVKGHIIEALIRYQQYKMSTENFTTKFVTFALNYYLKKNYRFRLQFNFRKLLSEKGVKKSSVLTSLHYAF